MRDYTADGVTGKNIAEAAAKQAGLEFRAWDAGNLNVARALLDSYRPQRGAQDLRGVDWRWLWVLCRSEAKRKLPTQGEWQLFVAEPSPDGRRFATAGFSKDIVLYDLASRSKLQTLTGHTHDLTNLHSVAFSPDGRRLASVSGGIFAKDGPFELLLWDLATGSETNLETRSSSFEAVAFSPGSGWPWYLSSAGFGSKVSRWLTPPHMNSEITFFARGLKCGCFGENAETTPGVFSQPAARRPS